MGSVDGGLSRLQKSFLTRRQKNKDFFETNLTKYRFDKIGCFSETSPFRLPELKQCGTFKINSSTNRKLYKSSFQLINSFD